MLRTLDSSPRHHPQTLPLKCIEIELNLNSAQRLLWQEFEDTFDEISNAIEAVDAIVDMQVRDRAPLFVERLKIESRYLAMQLGARRRLVLAANNLLASLTPRQQLVAERHLRALMRLLGHAPRWSTWM